MSDISISQFHGPNTPVLAMATVDELTVFGNGTALAPLHAANLAGARQGTFQPPLPLSPALGMVVASLGGDRYAPAGSGAGFNPQAVGLISAIDPIAHTIVVKDVGSLTLTTAQWDLITGQVGGLTAGLGYFVSNTLLGGLTTAPSTAAGTFVSAVGVAFSSTVMLLALPSVPFLNP